MEDLSIENAPGPTGRHNSTVHLPAPTAWPMVLALGIALICTGMVTHWVIALLGLMLVLPAVVGWFREVLPSENMLHVAVSTEIVPVFSPEPYSLNCPTAKALANCCQ